MAPGTVTVVQQVNKVTSLWTSECLQQEGDIDFWLKLQVADEQEVSNSGNQLMVVNEEGGLTGNQVMVVNEDGGLTSNQVMVVEDGHGLEALTVLTQDDNTHHYIVYVQEHTVEIN